MKLGETLLCLWILCCSSTTLGCAIIQFAEGHSTVAAVSFGISLFGLGIMLLIAINSKIGKS